MAKRRTTVMVDEESLATLGSEATRRGVARAVILREAIESSVAKLRSSRRPRVGIARSTDGRRASDLAVQPIGEPPS